MREPAGQKKGPVRADRAFCGGLPCRPHHRDSIAWSVKNVVIKLSTVVTTGAYWLK